MVRTMILAVLLPAAVFTYVASRLDAVPLPFDAQDATSLLFVAFGIAALTLVRD